MDAAQRQLTDELDTATQRLIDEARLMTGADLQAPSLLPGWSRAHVVAHLARDADAMRSLLIGARAGLGAGVRRHRHLGRCRGHGAGR